MSDKLVIIGAGGHGKVVADIAFKNGYGEICFVDDNAIGDCLGFPIVGRCDDIITLNDGKTDFFIAVGNNSVRKKISEKYNVPFVSLIHPSAQLGLDTKVGEGTVIMAGAVVNASAKIGKHCIINSNSVVEHDNRIADYVHISPGAALGGTVAVGEATHIGIGVSVKNNTSICDGCVIGAGAAVVKDLQESAVYVGVPAEKV